MLIEVGSVVKSVAGRDANRFYLVLGLEGDFALIADGKVRKLETPKRKRLKHLSPTRTRADLSRLDTNSKIKKELSGFNSEKTPVTEEEVI